MGLLETIRSKVEITHEPIGIAVEYDKDGIPTIHQHKTTGQIKTLEKLLESANVDLTKWEVERWKPNVWNSYSNANGIIPLWQVTAHCRRREMGPKQIEELMETAIAGFERGLSTIIPTITQTATGKMALIAVPDLHLGKLAWGKETGHGNWNCKIAKKAWEEAITDILQKLPEADECWLPIGNDFFNVDDDKQQTTAGTPQDEDGRWQKTYEMGCDLIEWAIAKCRQKFPKVKVIVVYGNHDRGRSYVLGSMLARLAKYWTGIEVHNDPIDRKFFQWGETGIGFAHGDRLKEKDLAHLCANEGRKIWGRTKRFELFLGHLHHTWFRHLGGVLVRTLDALCSPDYYHAKSGYVTNEKTASGFLYDHRGMKNQYVHYPTLRNYL